VLVALLGATGIDKHPELLFGCTILSFGKQFFSIEKCCILSAIFNGLLCPENYWKAQKEDKITQVTIHRM
jgi:hypothetical protein